MQSNHQLSSEAVRVLHTCQICGFLYGVGFPKPENVFNPFETVHSLDSQLPRIYMAGRDFIMQSNDWYFASTMKECQFLRWNESTRSHESYSEIKLRHLENQAIEKTVIYTDTTNAKVYEWQAIAFLEGGIIHRFLYLNGKLHNHITWIHHKQNNPYNRWLCDPKEAVLSALSHAEKLTGEMARGEWATI